MFSDRKVCENIVDPDQTAPQGTVQKLSGQGQNSTNLVYGQLNVF